MKVKDLMETNIYTISQDATYAEAAKVLYTNQISGAPVVDATGKMVGVISEKDLYRVLYPFYKSFYENPEMYTDPEGREDKVLEIKDKKITNFMVTDVVTVNPETPILSAGAIMFAHSFGRLPVVENGKLVGIISRKTIFRTVLKQKLGL